MLYDLVSQWIAVALVALVPLPETIFEEEPLMVCATLSGVDYTDIPFTVNFTISSGQGAYFGVSGTEEIDH